MSSLENQTNESCCSFVDDPAQTATEFSADILRGADQLGAGTAMSHLLRNHIGAVCDVFHDESPPSAATDSGFKVCFHVSLDQEVGDLLRAERFRIRVGVATDKGADRRDGVSVPDDAPMVTPQPIQKDAVNFSRVGHAGIINASKLNRPRSPAQPNT